LVCGMAVRPRRKGSAICHGTLRCWGAIDGGATHGSQPVCNGLSTGDGALLLRCFCRRQRLRLFGCWLCSRGFFYLSFVRDLQCTLQAEPSVCCQTSSTALVLMLEHLDGSHVSLYFACHAAAMAIFLDGNMLQGRALLTTGGGPGRSMSSSRDPWKGS